VTNEAGVEPLRDSVEETFDTLEAQQAEAFELIEGEYDGMSADVIERIGDQVDLLVELSEEVETQLSELLEDFPDDAVLPEEFVEEFESQLEAVTEQFEDQLTTLSELDGTDTTAIEIDDSKSGSESEESGE